MKKSQSSKVSFEKEILGFGNKAIKVSFFGYELAKFADPIKGEKKLTKQNYE